MSADSKLLFRWRWLIASGKGPSSPTTRHILLTLSLHMATDGSHAFPSEDLLALETGLTSRAVGIHLQTAVEHGWILRHRERRRGKSWAQYFYQAAIPAHLDAPEGRSPPNFGGPEPDSQGTERDSTEAPNDVPLNTAGISRKRATAEGHLSEHSRTKRHEDCAAILAEIKRRGSLIVSRRTQSAVASSAVLATAASNPDAHDSVGHGPQPGAAP